MDFIEIAVEAIDGEAAETVGELFNRFGYGGAVMEAFPPDFEKVTVRTVVAEEDDEKLRHIEMMLALIDKALPNGLPEPKLRVVGKTDWANAWRENFHAIRVGKRFVIKPSWREYTAADDDLIIEIDPGLAFGSGLHPTTQLCLMMLEDLPLADKTIFDVGTGSAILSLAALKLGATQIRAVDVDDIAVRVAEENFERNGYSTEAGSIETSIGSADDVGGQTWDVVIANILAHILIEIMAGLRAALAPDGVLMLSGIINEQEESMLQALQEHNLSIITQQAEGDWIAFLVKAEQSD